MLIVYEKKYGVSLKILWSIMLIMLLFLPLIFFENSFDKRAGALKLVLKWRPQLSVVKFSSLSFSNNEALLIKQSKYFNLDLANFTIFYTSVSLLKSPLTR